MGKSVKQQAKEYFVKGKFLNCPVCLESLFYHGKVQLNTKLATLFNLDWTNKSAHCYTCVNCSHIIWFMEELQ